MFLVSILSFIFSSSICIQQLVANVVFFTGNLPVANVIFDLYFPLSSFSILVEPYFILFFNKGLRKELADLMTKKKYKKEAEVTVVSRMGY
ncbi:unnamed protein product [Nippostrongylus brasiliensis]|uniref:Serpentine receptor class gamma n=1 Tax=Nippostrongylus brasiliensis TaxID=27835 RepID=A0A0N4YGA0_NIPBR|nr:hypothetical protein Q1695_002152 [Nippostrongylus brasiliensis]VDL79422.1 unnamed protein product [Nippostrongylus brasiliensis]